MNGNEFFHVQRMREHEADNRMDKVIQDDFYDETHGLSKYAPPALCKHDHLDMDGCCRRCGADCRGIH